MALLALGAALFSYASAVDDTRVMVLGPDSGVVTYRATLAAGQVFVTTVYARRHGTWQGVLYQQTPLPAAAPS